MTIETTTVLKNFEGESFKDGEKDLTLRKVICAIISTTKSPDPLLSYLLTERIAKNDEVELTSEEVVFIKSLVKESTYLPYIQGTILNLLG